ncbi:thymidine kinase, partial [Xanthomonas hyacinthi DSM 19077]
EDPGRAVPRGPQVEIGGNARYVSVSRAEFKSITAGDGRIELQQSVLPLGESEPDEGKST